MIKNQPMFLSEDFLLWIPDKMSVIKCNLISIPHSTEVHERRILNDKTCPKARC